MVSVPILPFAIVVLVLLGGIYSTYGKRNKIFCFYEGEDGTNEFRWVKNTDGWVIFRGFKHKILPERITNMWLKNGIHMLFPTRVACLNFVWYSAWPRDSKNYGRTLVSPKVRKMIDLSEMVGSYFKTSTPTSSTKKQGLLEKYGLFIALGLIVIVAWYLNNNMQELAAGMNAMQAQINTVLPH